MTSILAGDNVSHLKPLRGQQPQTRPTAPHWSCCQPGATGPHRSRCQPRATPGTAAPQLEPVCIRVSRNTGCPMPKDRDHQHLRRALPRAAPALWGRWGQGIQHCPAAFHSSAVPVLLGRSFWEDLHKPLPELHSALPHGSIASKPPARTAGSRSPGTAGGAPHSGVTPGAGGEVRLCSASRCFLSAQALPRLCLRFHLPGRPDGLQGKGCRGHL